MNISIKKRHLFAGFLILASTFTGTAFSQPLLQQDNSSNIPVFDTKQTISVAPEGNQIPTLVRLNAQARAVSPSVREFMVNLGFVSSVGGSMPNVDKVTLYTGITCQPGSGNCWAVNPLAAAAPGFKGSVQTLEADLNNFSGDAPVGGPLRTALAANGAINSNFYNTSGLFIGSVNMTPIFHAGVLGDNKAIVDALILDHDGEGAYSYLNLSRHSAATFADNGVSPAGISLGGTYSLGAIITAKAKVGIGAIVLGNTQAIVSQTADDKNNVALLSMDAANVVHVGVGARGVTVPFLVETQSIVPTRSTSPCVPGQHAWDQSFEYRCIGPNQWKRAALTAW